MEQRTKATSIAMAGAATAALLAACGSSGGSSGAAGSTSAPATTGATGAASTTVAVRSTPLGQVLVDGQGRTVYLLTADKNSASTCNGGCAAVWPPVTTTGAPAVGSGAKASHIGTTTRSDGSKQVTYNGHPVYFYSGDTSPGNVNGEGINSFGGRWYALTATGSAITGAPSQPSAPSQPGY